MALCAEMHNHNNKVKCWTTALAAGTFTGHSHPKKNTDGNHDI